MASVIKAGNATDGVQVTSDNTGILELKTGTGSGTTAMTVGTGQNVTFAQAANLPNTFGFKNRIINGGMVIDQRNAGASVTAGSGYTFFTDRFKIYSAGASKLSGQQVSVSTTGFKKALKLTSLAATTPAAGDEYELYHNIEGFNVADLMWGTANAQPVTLSFIVNSSLTGTFAGCINNQTFGGTTYSYVFTYTVSAANTDTVVSVTIPGSTAGSWETGSGVGFQILWDLGSGSNYNGTAGSWVSSFKVRTSGSVNVIGTNGATFYITGVQLEKGSTATSFDYRPYGTELQLCMRYFQRMGGVSNNFGVQGYQLAGGGVSQTLSLLVPMRAAPTATLPTMSNINTGGLIVNAISAECALILAAATTNGSVSSINTGAGYATFSIEL